MRRMTLIAVAMSMLAGCGGKRSPPGAESAGDRAAPSSQKDASPSPAAPGPAVVPAPRDPTSAVQPPPPPATDGTAGDSSLARFDGYGDIPFGTPATDVPRLWGGELKVSGKDFNDRCYFMLPLWVRRPSDLAFMISEGRFARMSTEDPRLVAPGGARVGMTTADVRRLYPGGIEIQPHHYTDGQYLRVKDPTGGKGVLVLETDGKGDDAQVTEWRIGVPPEVDYVEGCS